MMLAIKLDGVLKVTVYFVNKEYVLTDHRLQKQRPSYKTLNIKCKACTYIISVIGVGVLEVLYGDII